LKENTELTALLHAPNFTQQAPTKAVEMKSLQSSHYRTQDYGKPFFLPPWLLSHR